MPNPENHEWLALDIGGANLKAADGRGYAASRPFPLWQRPGALAAELTAMLADAPPCSAVAVTMTGELADCYATKAEGVQAIIDAVHEAAGSRALYIYLVGGELALPEVAREVPLRSAASNWHALSAWACRHASGPSLLVDIGSTTSDLIPLTSAEPTAVGKTDPERLQSGELVYTGVSRTPVASVVRKLAWRGRPCPVASELFATTLDAYLLLGDIPEQPDLPGTADGRPATRAAAHARLARMICADSTLMSYDGAVSAAREIAQAQIDLLQRAAGQVLGRIEPVQTVLVAGEGEFLAQRLAKRVAPDAKIVSLTALLGEACSRCAPAHALAMLAGEQELADSAVKPGATAGLSSRAVNADKESP